MEEPQELVRSVKEERMNSHGYPSAVGNKQESLRVNLRNVIPAEAIQSTENDAQVVNSLLETRKEHSQSLTQTKRKRNCKPATEEQETDEQGKYGTDKVIESKSNREEEMHLIERIILHVVDGNVDHLQAENFERLYRVR